MAAIAADTGPTGLDHWTTRTIAIVALCFAINMADGIDVTILSFIAPRVQADWAIGADVMGTLFSAGLLGMAIGGMFIAPLADRFGRRRIILAALVLMSAGMLASGMVTTVTQFFVLRVLVGAGIGTVLAAMAALAAESAPDHHRNLAVGLVQAGYPFAAIFTGLVVARLLPVHGWHVLLVGAGAITVVLFPLAWLLLSDARTRGNDDSAPQAGVYSEGLMITRLPPASMSTSGPRLRSYGKFQGTMLPMTPLGSRRTSA